MNPANANKILHKEGLRIAKLIQQSGFKAFWVGGTVRDMLLGRQLDNIDIATSAKPEETERILSDAGYTHKPVGKAYGTILALTKGGPIEVTTFRREGRYVNRRRPEQVVYIDDYVEDSKRRDFTINSMYYDPATKELLDPQNGKNDVARKLLKFVGDPKKRIDEDALRMLRAARFSAQLGFKLEKNSYAAIKTRAKYIQSISGERVKAELDKILSSPNRERGVRLLDELGLLKFIMPEVVKLKHVWHKSQKYHLEGSVFEHALLTLNHIPEGDSVLGYAALFHDAGKATTAVPMKKDEGVVNSFPSHQNISADLFKKFALRLKFSKSDIDLILWITKMHMKKFDFTVDTPNETKIKLADHKFFPKLIQLWRADDMANLRLVHGKKLPGGAKAYQEAVKMLANINAKKKMIETFTRGEFIMKHAQVSPGPKISAIKSAMKKFILEEKVLTLRDAKKFLGNFVK